MHQHRRALPMKALLGHCCNSESKQPWCCNPLITEPCCMERCSRLCHILYPLKAEENIDTTPENHHAQPSSKKQAKTQVSPRYDRACIGSSPPGSSTLSVWSPHRAARSGPATARACPSDAANTMTRAGAASSPALRSPAHASQRLWGPWCRHTCPPM